MNRELSIVGKDAANLHPAPLDAGWRGRPSSA
jgi:hypothetical protein